MNASGGSQRTATRIARRCMSDTIPAENSVLTDTATRSSDLAKSSCCAPSELTQCSVGGSSSTTAGSKASTAPSSETSRRISARTLFGKRIKSLIAGGLIAGITPTSIRKRSPQRTLDIAFSKLAGVDADKAKADC